MYEEFCEELYLVAMFQYRIRKQSETLPDVPENSQNATKGSGSAVEVAGEALDLYSRG